jgi:hypothetical protein
MNSKWVQNGMINASSALSLINSRNKKTELILHHYRDDEHPYVSRNELHHRKGNNSSKSASNFNRIENKSRTKSASSGLSKNINGDLSNRYASVGKMENLAK